MEHLQPAAFTQLVFKAMDSLCGLPTQLSTLGLDLSTAVTLSEKLQQVVRRLHNLRDPAAVQDFLTTRFSQDQAAILQRCYALRRKDLHRAFLDEVLSQRRLKSFDWNVSVQAMQMVLTGQHMQEINEPMLQLELVIDTGAQDDRVVLELSRDDVDMVVQKLSALKEVLAMQRSQRPLEPTVRSS